MMLVNGQQFYMIQIETINSLCPPTPRRGGGLKKIIQKKYQNIAGKAGNAKKAFPVFYLTRANAYMAKFKRIRT